MEKNMPKDANNSQKNNHYKVRGRLDLSRISDLDKDLPIRISAVHGNCILSSELIHLQERKDRKINFDLEFQLPGPKCGVNLLVSRGDLQEAKIQSLEGIKHRISASQWKESKKGRNPFTTSVGNIVIEDRIYKRWLFLCRRYTIRGKVVCRHSFYDQNENKWVFEDTPVPGATVEAYDVDCWWWWCFKDIIGTAVTDLDGTFEMNFTWCCRVWFPFPAPWTVDPGLLERIRELLAAARLPIPLPDPPPEPFEFQEYLASLVESSATGPMAASADRVAALLEPEVSSDVSAQTLKTLLPPAPDLEALHIWPWWHRRDCTPDVLFKVTQPCGGEVQIVYEEGIDQTRWNIAQTMNVTLEANEKACCVPSQPEPPCGDCLGITQVGCTDITNIGISAGPPDLRGYAYPGNLDRPFGDRLVIRGEFGEDAHDSIDFYRVEYHKEGAAPGTWNDMGSVAELLGSISRKYLDPVGFTPSGLSDIDSLPTAP